MTTQEQINQIIKQYEELLAKQSPEVIEQFKQQELANITDLYGELVSYIDKQTKVPFGTTFIHERTGKHFILASTDSREFNLINIVSGIRWTQPSSIPKRGYITVADCIEAFGEGFQIQIKPEEEI